MFADVGDAVFIVLVVVAVVVCCLLPLLLLCVCVCVLSVCEHIVHCDVIRVNLKTHLYVHAIIHNMSPV